MGRRNFFVIWFNFVGMNVEFFFQCQKALHKDVFWNGILLPKLFWPTVRKKCSSDRGKTFEIRGWRPIICKNFEITSAIHWNSESSEEFKLEKMIEFRNIQENLYFVSKIVLTYSQYPFLDSLIFVYFCPKL